MCTQTNKHTPTHTHRSLNGRGAGCKHFSSIVCRSSTRIKKPDIFLLHSNQFPCWEESPLAQRRKPFSNRPGLPYTHTNSYAYHIIHDIIYILSYASYFSTCTSGYHKEGLIKQCKGVFPPQELVGLSSGSNVYQNSPLFVLLVFGISTSVQELPDVA